MYKIQPLHFAQRSKFPRHVLFMKLFQLTDCQIFSCLIFSDQEICHALIRQKSMIQEDNQAGALFKLFFIRSALGSIIQGASAVLCFQQDCSCGCCIPACIETVSESVSVFLASRLMPIHRIDDDRNPFCYAFFTFSKAFDLFQRCFYPGLRNRRRDCIFADRILNSFLQNAPDDWLAVPDRPWYFVPHAIHAVERITCDKKEKCRAVPDVSFQRFVISVADCQTFIIPDFPAGFIQCFEYRQNRISVLVRIADKNIRLFFIGKKRCREFFKSGRQYPVKGLKLIVVKIIVLILQTVPICV